MPPNSRLYPDEIHPKNDLDATEEPPFHLKNCAVTVWGEPDYLSGSAYAKSNSSFVTKELQ